VRKRSANLLTAVPAFALSLIVQGIVAAQSPMVWVVPSLQRVGRSDAASSGTQAQLYAAKGEYESFQVVVRAPSSGLTNVNVSVTDLTGSGGTISKTNLALFREQYVYVNASSPNWGGSNQPLGVGWYADGLIPFVDQNTGLAPSGGSIQAAPFSVGGNANQPVWIDVFVPRTAAAGQYTGTYTVTSNQGSTSGQIVLHVWNFTLPAQSTLKSSFAYFTQDSLAGEQELLRNKVSPLNVSALNELGLLNNFGLSTANMGFFSGADVSSCTMSAAPSVLQFQVAAAVQQKGLYLFDYSADEVGNCSNLYTTIKQWGYNMHQAGINNLVTMAPVTALFDDGSSTGRSAVDDWVVLPVSYDSSVSTIEQALQKGDEVWSYNTLVQDAYSPKWEIDFAPINFRMQPGFINQSLNLTGLLYWRVDDWSSSPWTNPNNAGTFSSNNYPGEGMLVYPGSTVGVTGVAPSMRLKWIRDGVEDYEYVALLKKAGKGSWALQVAESVGPNWTSWTRDANVLESARQQLGQELDSLGGGTSSGGTSGSAPRAPVNPTPAISANGISTAPTLSWSASTNATSYDVYLGTSSTPPPVGTVTGTSYQGGSLQASAAYNWRVVAKNTSGSTSSAMWSFVTAAASTAGEPAAVSVSPSTGSGLYHTFSLVFSDSAGYQSLSGVHAVFNTSASGTNACWIYYDTAGKTLWLAADDATARFATIAGSATTVRNSQCQITGSGVSSSGSGTNLTLNVAILFATSFAGAKNTYLSATDKGGTSSNLGSKGTWTVPPSAALGAVAVSPSSGTGFNHPFTFVFSDPSTYASLTGAHILVNSSVSGTNACWIYLDPFGKAVWLSNDSTSSWQNAAVGSATTLQNSQCSIPAGGVSMSGSGTNLTVEIPITFTSTFTGTRNLYLSATDKSGTSSSYVQSGSWIVP
jgi:hypothetical protein